jgi:hypothetical protein
MVSVRKYGSFLNFSLLVLFLSFAGIPVKDTFGHLNSKKTDPAEFSKFNTYSSEYLNPAHVRLSIPVLPVIKVFSENSPFANFRPNKNLDATVFNHSGFTHFSGFSALERICKLQI